MAPSVTAIASRVLALGRGDRVFAAQPGGGELHRFQDVFVARAAADVAREPVLDLVRRRIRNRLEQLVGGHEEAGGAEPALEPVLIAKGLLDGMEGAVGVSQ